MLFDDRQEDAGRELATLRGLPADQRFDADDLAGAHVDLGLVIEDELLPNQRAADVFQALVVAAQAAVLFGVGFLGLRIEGQAEAGGNLQQVSADAYRMRGGFEQAVEHWHAGRDVVQILQYGDELVAAEPCARWPGRCGRSGRAGRCRLPRSAGTKPIGAMVVRAGVFPAGIGQLRTVDIDDRVGNADHGAETIHQRLQLRDVDELGKSVPDFSHDCCFPSRVGGAQANRIDSTPAVIAPMNRTYIEKRLAGGRQRLSPPSGCWRCLRGSSSGGAPRGASAWRSGFRNARGSRCVIVAGSPAACDGWNNGVSGGWRLTVSCGLDRGIASGRASRRLSSTAR